MSAAQRILGQLAQVKPTGQGRWVARCPAHKDRSPSLSIRELEDGRVLLHDFGGCEVGDVLGALGFSMGDLFDKPLAHQVPASHSGIPARDLLVVADHEILVASLILEDVVQKRRVSEAQVTRLIQAAARIGAARDVGNPARIVVNA